MPESARETESKRQAGPKLDPARAVCCTREAADRVHSFLKKLDARLPEEQRDTIGLAFRELLLNAVEWGGKLDPIKGKVMTTAALNSMLGIDHFTDPVRRLRCARQL